MKQPITFATNQPNIFYKGSHGALDGSTVDDESNLLIGSIQTNPKCKLNLQPRQFVSVPYLGRGPAHPLLESKLQQGSDFLGKKSCKTITEKSYNNEKTPLFESLQRTIQNPANLIEDVANDGWIRGGLPSRQLAISAALKKK